MRTALLPAGADPFLLSYWLRNCREVWRDEVDEVRILACGMAPGGEDFSDVAHYLEDEAAKTRATISFVGSRVDHGVAIARLIAETDASHVMLCEDDCYVRTPGAIDWAFGHIEADADVLGSPRATATPEVRDMAARRFGWQVMETSESGPFLWPSFLFARTDMLRKVDNYGVKHWMPGDSVSGLNAKVKEENDADTFADASMQLMAMGARVKWVPQYRSDEALMSGWLSMSPPWFHVGSLSGSTDYLLGRKTHVDRDAWIADMRGNSDWAKRVSFWGRVSSHGEGLPAIRDAYRAELTSATLDSGLPPSLINDWTRRFDPYITWTEG